MAIRIPKDAVILNKIRNEQKCLRIWPHLKVDLWIAGSGIVCHLRTSFFDLRTSPLTPLGPEILTFLSLLSNLTWVLKRESK